MLGLRCLERDVNKDASGGVSLLHKQIFNSNYAISFFFIKFAN